MRDLQIISILGTDLEATGAISDLDLFLTASGPVLYATSRISGTITAYAVGAGHGTGTAPVIDVQGVTGKADDLGPLEIDLVDFAGQTRAVTLSGAPTGLPSYKIAADGSLSGRQDLDAPGLAGPVWAMASVETPTQSLIFAATRTPGTLGTYALQGDGTLAALSAPAPPPGAPADIAALTALKVGGSDILVLASAGDDRVHSYKVRGDGGLKLIDRLGASDGLGINAPAALASVVVEGQSFVLVGAAGSSSISVLEVAADGTLSATDHVIDSRDTRFAGITALDGAVIDGQAWVAAGGGDDGVTLFRLLPTGRLVAVATLADGLDSTLANIAALTLGESGGGLSLFAASAAEGGVTWLGLDLDPAGKTLTAAPSGGRLAGTSGGDILLGGAGKDDLRGKAGDDVLVGGDGKDILRGGAGGDLFVIDTGDDKTDTIRDFEPGADRLDLSGWAMLRDAAQLTMTALQGGIEVRFNGATLKILSADGTALSPGDITAALLPGSFIHAATGSLSAGRVLTGSAGDDSLTGGRGDDHLQGLDGADRLDGGKGTDTAVYAEVTGRLVVDLKKPQANTGAAAGDSFSGIENVTGGAGRDKLIGDDGANLLQGGDGKDRLIGRKGDDRLEGGPGDDQLEGGPGADALIGGAGTDRAVYKKVTDPLTIDLAHPGANTGQARGDSFSGIENVTGGSAGDVISGDDGANRIWGKDGHDTLSGRAGNDDLYGGKGRDRLEGGAGNDRLEGGGGADTFVFERGHDTLVDFDPGKDRIELVADALWDGTLTPGKVINRFAEITSGSVVLDFGDPDGSGAVLTIDGLDTTDGLADLLTLL
ncbi:MAG: M10 family metallopeptidase C-terminal domain-containing protein [Marinibacterium sp.]